MMCGKCRYEFCWSCLGSYFGYVHAEERYCPSRYTMLVFTIMLLIILLNQKLFYFSTYFYAFEFYLFRGFLGCIIIDLLTFSLVSYLPLGATLFSINKYNPPTYFMRFMSLIGILVALTIHSSFIYFSCYTDNYPFLWFSVRCMFWELAVALAGGIIVALGYLGNKLYKWMKSNPNKKQLI